MRVGPVDEPRRWPTSNCSRSTTASPRSASRLAAAEPTAPPPTTTASACINRSALVRLQRERLHPPLLQDRAHRAVRVHLRDALPERRLERGLVLAEPDRDGDDRELRASDHEVLRIEPDVVDDHGRVAEVEVDLPGAKRVRGVGVLRERDDLDLLLTLPLQRLVRRL